MNSKYNIFFLVIKRKSTIWVALSLIFCAFFVPSKDTYFILETPWGNAKTLIYKESYQILSPYTSSLTSFPILDTLVLHRVLKNHSIICSFTDSTLINKLNSKRNLFICPSDKIHKKGAIGIVFETENNITTPYLYIITGKTYTRQILEKQQFKNEKDYLKQCLIRYLETENKNAEVYRLNRYAKSFDTLYLIYKKHADSIFNLCGNHIKENFIYNDAQIANYITIGGVPQLDGNRFWLIGEVYSDIEVIERIAINESDDYISAQNKHKLVLKLP